MSKLLHGARSIVLINGVVLGVTAGVRFLQRTPIVEVGGIDMLDPAELVPSKTSVVGSLTIYRAAGDGGAEGAALTGPARFVSRQKYFRLELLDRKSKQVQYTCRSCMVEEQAWNFAPHELVQGQISYRGIELSSEASVFLQPLKA